MKKQTHAKENGTLRSAGNQIREKGSKRLRHLPGGNEAKAKRRKEKVSVDYPATRKARDYKQLDLLQRRDDLFDTYLNMVDRLTAWQKNAVDAYFTLSKNSMHKLRMIKLLTAAKDETTKELLSLDEQISPCTLSNG